MNFGKAAGRAAGIALCASLAAGSLAAQNPLLSAPIHYTLRNGLKVILSESFDVPAVSVVVSFNAGSIHELPGKTGLSYLMEKLMMFAGSANVSPFQHIALINRVGGSLNANALEDRTLFFQTVPSHQLALALWLESDRMRFLNLTEVNFERARDGLIQELRERRAAEPFMESLFAFDQLLYSDFPYSHPLIGSEEDVRGLTLDDARLFYDSFYSPANAVLCVAGNFNKLKARELITRYFDTLSPGTPPTTAFEPLAYIRKPVEKTFADVLATSPAVYIGFRLAPPYAADYPILTLIDYVIMRGRSSRFPRRLLNRDAKIAYQLTGGLERRRDRTVYKVLISASQAMVPVCRDAVFAELDKLKRTFLGDAELAKAKTLFRQDILSRLSTSSDRALFLAESHWVLNLTGKTLDDLSAEMDKVLGVTASDVIGIINRYFTVDNSVVLNVRMR